ncbi:MAG: hypothetical protein CL677_04335 [Bdellovibrionaceae bacterium]|nr:hypothetical protein [Pseudobdellovibrionaceae bacterium]
MAFVNSVIFILALLISWNYINSPSVVNEETHMSIRADLQSIIKQVIQEQSPSASSIQFHKFWTETVNKESVKAHFRYSYIDALDNDESTPNEVTLDGYAIVNRAQDADEDFEYWNFEEFYILNNQVEYTKPLRVSPTANDN